MLCVALLAILLAVPHPQLEWEEQLALAQGYSSRRMDPHSPAIATATTAATTPLSSINTTIVITGATNGIGLALTRTLCKLGAKHILAIGRSSEKLKRLRDELPTCVRTFRCDLSDLEQVATTANEILKTTEKIDILVNNAGIHALWDMFAKDANVGGLDRVFVTNYLSHFLLTEKLLPKLHDNNGDDATRSSIRPKPVILQVSSSYHYGSDGTDLPEIAARPGGSLGGWIWRTQRQYNNSKLAQILHARALKKKYPHLRVVSICPGWVATGIARTSSIQTFTLQKLAFAVDGWGISSALHAMFSTDNGDDWYVNSKGSKVTGHLFPRSTPTWFYQWTLRDMMTTSVAMMILWTQHLFPYTGPAMSSPESYNETLSTVLYNWSFDAVAKYL